MVNVLKDRFYVRTALMWGNYTESTCVLFYTLKKKILKVVLSMSNELRNESDLQIRFFYYLLI